MRKRFRLAVLADIHANDEALQAVLADARAQHADGFAVAGDLLTDGPSPCETLARVLDLTPHVIRGNREEYLIRCRYGENKGWSEHKQTAAVIWTYRSLDASGLDAIERLPEQLQISLADGVSLRIVHGSPFNISELLKPNEDMAAVERAALAVHEQALVFGHNHMQWTGTMYGRLLLNPGSVGVHFNGECMAEYGLLTCENGKLSAELRRVAYDFSALERRLETSGLMQSAPVWTKITFEGVKAGRNYCLEFLNDAKAAMRAAGAQDGLIPNEIWDCVAERWWAKMGWGAAPVTSCAASRATSRRP